MFVSSNKVQDLKKYFFQKLEVKFSQREVKLMFQEFLLKRLSVTKSEILIADEITLSESDLLYFREMVLRLLDNEPFQYLLGETEFYGLTLKCDARALIPRPETEELVAWICETYKDKKDLQIVDFCTGTACIALSLKSIFLNSYIIATDVSNNALDLSKLNASANQLNVIFQQDDVLNSSLFLEDHSLDCIVSNPPYIPFMDKEKMEDNVLKFEPHIALFVENDDPLIFYSKIAQIAIKKLKTQGYLFFEIHEDMGNSVRELLKELDFQNIVIKQDLQGKNRMIRAQKK